MYKIKKGISALILVLTLIFCVLLGCRNAEEVYADENFGFESNAFKCASFIEIEGYNGEFVYGGGVLPGMPDEIKGHTLTFSKDKLAERELRAIHELKENSGKSFLFEYSVVDNRQIAVKAATAELTLIMLGRDDLSDSRRPVFAVSLERNRYLWVPAETLNIEKAELYTYTSKGLDEELRGFKIPWKDC